MLPPLQEAFAREYVRLYLDEAEACSAVEAYRRTRKLGGTEKTAWENACRLRRDSKVQSRIEELLAERRASEAVTRESHLKELARLKELAAEGKNYGAAVRGEELRGKVTGLYVERQEIATAPSLSAREMAEQAVALYGLVGDPFTVERIQGVLEGLAAPQHPSDNAGGVGEKPLSH